LVLISTTGTIRSYANFNPTLLIITGSSISLEFSKVILPYYQANLAITAQRYQFKPAKMDPRKTFLKLFENLLHSIKIENSTIIFAHFKHIT